MLHSPQGAAVDVVITSLTQPAGTVVYFTALTTARH